MTRRRIVSRLGPAALAVALLLTGWLDAAAPSAPAPPRSAGTRPMAGPPDGPPHVPGEVLIRFRAGAPEAERESVRAALGARRVRSFARSIEQLRLGRGRSVEEAVARYRDDPAVEFVEPNYLFRVDALPQDPYFDQLYGLRNVGQTGGTPGSDIGAEQAWELTTGGQGVVVAVIDSGIDYTHPDLAPNIWSNPGEIPGNGRDDDGNGYVDDVRGWDFANDDNDPMDDAGHGTHVAGTIGAVGDNRIGVTGVAWKVSLVPLKFIASDGYGTTADAVAAVDYATAIGADITNNSWGGGAASIALFEAIRASADAGVLFVAAAGNAGQNNDALPHYPASYDLPNILSVTALDHNDARPLFANLGPRTVDLGAAGVDVLSTIPGGVYGYSSGTSMAAPHASGAAALVRTLAPEIGVLELKQLLMDNVERVPSLAVATASGGRLDVSRSLAERDRTPPGAVAAVAGGAPSSNSVVLTWTATGDDGDAGAAAVYEVRYAAWPIDEQTFPRAVRFWDTPRPGPAGTEERLEVTGLAPGSRYYFALRALDEWGNRGPVVAAADEATTLPAPSFASTPSSFELALSAGDRALRTLDVSNAGAGTLDWTLRPDPAAPWLSVSPAGGRLGPGQSVRLTVALDTRGLVPGAHESSIDLRTNDPLVPLARHPVLLDLASAPAMELVPAAIDFGEVFVGAAQSVGIDVINFGTETLTVREIASDAEAVSVEPASVSVPAGGTSTIEVTFRPAQPGLLAGTLSLLGDAPNAPSAVVPLAGVAALPPGIEVTPPAIEAALLARTIETRTLRLDNPGPSPLVVDLRFQAGVNSGEPISSPLVNGGFETGDFSGWQAFDNGVFGRLPWTVSAAGAGLFGNSTPFEGTFDALNGFEGGGGLRYDLLQDLAIPPGATRADLSFHDRIQWDDLGLPGNLSRIYEAAIEDPVTGERLAPIVHQEILFDASGYHDLGWQRRSIDLLPWAGREIRLRMRQLVRETLTGPAQIEFDAFTLDVEGFPAWFRPASRRVVVGPGASADVEVAFDATDLLEAGLDAFIRLETNVPATPLVLVPVRLSVAGLPEIDLRGQRLQTESSATYSTRGATTRHGLLLPRPPGGGGTIELITESDLGDPGESATLSVEGATLGAIGNTGGDCVRTTRAFELDAARMHALGSDGVVEATVTNSSTVDPVCNPDRHTVRLAYDARADLLDFGTLYRGAVSVLSLSIDNPGTAPLSIAAIASDRPEFAPSLASAVVPIGGTIDVDVAFAPLASGAFEGRLTIASDDPDEPLLEIALSGVAIDPPQIAVDPPAVERTVPVGGRSTPTLRLTNTGDAALVFAAAVEPAGASFASVEPGAGAVPAGQGFDLRLGLDATGLEPGTYDAALAISGADPATPRAVVPLSLVVSSAPDIAVEGRSRTADSTADFAGAGARTTHALPIDVPPGGGGRLRITIIGDFGDANEIATVRAEGLVLGTLGGAGQDCAPQIADLDLDAAELAALAADGVVTLEIQNAPSVDDGCVANLHAVHLVWRERADPLEFGPTWVGAAAIRRLVIGNAGTEPLSVASIATSVPELGVSFEPAVLEPGEERSVDVRFEPFAGGALDARIEIASDDPDEPLVVLGASGSAMEPPVVTVDPAALDVSLAAGERVTRFFTVSNAGLGTLHFTALEAAPAQAFLALEPVSGSVPPGGAVELLVRIDAAGLTRGAYETTVVLESDDPRTPSLGVPVRLFVTGHPSLALSAERLDFGETFVGAERERALALSNTGSAELELRSVVSDAVEFEPRSLPATLAPGESTSLRVVFRPRHEGPADGALLLSTDDPDRPVVALAVSGAGSAPPRLDVDPAEILASSAAGRTVTHPLTLTNSGLGALDVALVALVEDPRPAAAAEFELAGSSPGPVACLVADPARRRLYALLRGGTGFRRFDAAAGAWQELAPAPFAASDACGAALAGRRIYTACAGSSQLGVYDVDGDVWWTLPSPVPDTSAIAADEAGRLYLVRGAVGRRFDPRDGTVQPIAAPLFDFGARGVLVHHADRLYAHRGDGPRWFVTYDVTADRWAELAPPPAGGAGRAAAIDPLGMDYYAAGPPGGAALLRHSLRDGTWRAESPAPFETGDGALAWLPDPLAGMFLARGSAGLEIARRVTRAGFAEVRPFAGVVPPGGSLDLDVRLDASELLAGVYRGRIEIASNDPAGPRVTVPLELEVTGEPEIAIAPPALDFGEVFVGARGELTLSIENRGTARLVVSSIASASPTISVSPAALVVPARASRTVTVRFAPLAAGTLAADLRVESDDPARPVAVLALAGTAIDPPALALDPERLDTTLVEGTRLVRTLRLENRGLGALDFSLAVVPAGAAFVSVEPRAGRIEPAGRLDVAVTFDASAAPRGVHAAEIALASNDPWRGAVAIPATLTVAGLPRIAVGAAPVMLESTLAFTVTRPSTMHPLRTVVPPSGTGTLELVAEGDYGNPGEGVTILAEGVELGQAGPGNADCGVLTASVPLAAPTLAALAADGLIEIEVRNTSAVQAFCPANRHSVRLRYVGAAERLEYGIVFLGAARELSLIVENLGTAALELGPLSSDRPDFEPAVAALSIPPGSSASLPVVFHPSSVGTFEGVLDLVSNDPGRPSIAIALAGSGAEAPRIGVEPDRIEDSVPEGGRLDEVLSLTNSGAGPLDFSISVAPPDATWVRPASGAGTVAPSGSVELRLAIDASELAVGAHAAELVIVTNDPLEPRVVVPLAIEVLAAPNLAHVGQRVTLQSEMAFDTVGAVTRHFLPVSIPPAGDGRFEIVADGDYGQSIEFAFVSAEGTVIGSVGGVGADCVPSFGIFGVDAAQLAALVDDGVVEVEVQNANTVDPGCPVNAHTVRLVYEARGDSVDFGTVFVGRSRRRSLTLVNRGQLPLDVRSIVAEPAEFRVSPGALVLAPGESASVDLDFEPGSAGEIAGRLLVSSDDPDTPLLAVPLAGIAADPPLLGVSVAPVERTLFEGQRAAAPLALANAGASPLEFALEVVEPEGFEGGYALFGTDGGGGGLYTIDPATGHATFVGPLGVAAPSLAVDPTTGVMYVGRGGGAPWLYTVDPSTAAIRLVGDTGLGEAAIEALDFDAAGRLYGSVNILDGPGTGGDHLALIDPQTAETRVLGPFGHGIGTRGGPSGIAGLAFDPVTGTLYGASAAHADTVGPPSLYVIDRDTGDASFVARIVDANGQSVPGGVGSLQFDPAGVLFGGTGRGTGDLIRIDPATGRYTLVGHAVPSALGALALRKNPADLSFVAVAPAAGAVPPFDALDLEVAFDARGLPPGPYRARLVVTTNDLARPQVEIPLALSVVGVPDIALAGEAVALESTQEYTGDGARTTHELALPRPAAGGATVELEVDGDFGLASEVARLVVGDLLLGTVGNTGADCFAGRGTFVLSERDFDGVSAGGALQVEVTNSQPVGSICEHNRHTVRVRYDAPREGLDFGTVFVGHPRTVPLRIENDGRAELAIAAIEAGSAEIELPFASATVQPFGALVLPVTFAPYATGSLSSTLTLRSNDPDEPVVTVALTGQAIGVPLAEVEPGSIEVALAPHGDRPIRRTARLSNTGTSDLVWRAELVEVAPTASAAWREPEKGDESANGAGALAAERTGGPDAFGYRFADSDGFEGPRLEWIDIGAMATPLALAGDDENSGPVPIGFDFPFYGESFNAVYVSSNGWLSFTSDRTSYGNPPALPSVVESVPENLVAPFWDDLDLRGARAVSYHGDASRFVVQFTNAGRFSSGASLTFQVVLFPSGRILFQYLSMVGVLDSATVGIQDGSRTSGLVVAYNEDYVHDGLAVELVPIAPWSSVAPAAGVIPPGGFADLAVELRSDELDAGVRAAELLVRSNDPVHGELRVPLTLRTATAALARFEIHPATLQLASRARTVRAVLELSPDLDPHDIVLGSVRIGGTLAPVPYSATFGDDDGNGVEELGLSFDRRELLRLLGQREPASVTISGEVAGQAWFTGATEVRVVSRPPARGRLGPGGS